MGRGWIGVDLDGVLARYDGWVAPTHIGAPIPKMRKRVQQWLAEGRDVRIFTARVYPGTGITPTQLRNIYDTIEDWSFEVFGCCLPITCTKDYDMIELWDDRAVQIVPNTGERADGKE